MSGGFVRRALHVYGTRHEWGYQRSSPVTRFVNRSVLIVGICIGLFLFWNSRKSPELEAMLKDPAVHLEVPSVKRMEFRTSDAEKNFLGGRSARMVWQEFLPIDDTVSLEEAINEIVAAVEKAGWHLTETQGRYSGERQGLKRRITIHISIATYLPQTRVVVVIEER